MLRRENRLAAVALVLAGCLTTTASAQASMPPRTPGTISGIVLDTLGAPIPGAEIFYGDDRVRVVGAADGTFRFTGVRRGDYTVTARHVGYIPQSREVTVGDSGGTVRFSLVALTTSLPAAVTTVKQTGLGGIVTDSAFRPLAGVRVQAVGGAAGNGETDSTGRYRINATAGRYFLRVSRDGYRSVTTTVNLNADEGREVNFRMIPDATYSLVRERVAAGLMQMRLATRSPYRSRLFTRADIDQMGARSLDDLVRRSGLGGSACVATINGAEQAPVWAIDIADLEFVELYEGGVGTVARARPGDPLTASGGSRGCTVTTFVWYRR